MSRRNFYEILKETPVNLLAEYRRIHNLFFQETSSDIAIVDSINEVFELLPKYLRGRALSVSDFNETFGFSFLSFRFSVEMDDLLSLCEYVWNLSESTIKYAYQAINNSTYENINYLLNLIRQCMDDFNHIPLKREDITIFVPKKQDVIAVSEIIKKEVAVSVLEYHHYGLKGNLSKKKSILKIMADDIEPQRKLLNGINKTLADNLFQMLQKFVRHNNDNNPYINSLSAEELEDCYDDIYQMWLLAKLEIDNLDRKKRVEEVIKNINSKDLS